jgi:hypothetical protein
MLQGVFYVILHSLIKPLSSSSSSTSHERDRPAVAAVTPLHGLQLFEEELASLDRHGRRSWRPQRVLEDLFRSSLLDAFVQNLVAPSNAPERSACSLRTPPHTHQTGIQHRVGHDALCKRMADMPLRRHMLAQGKHASTWQTCPCDANCPCV